MTLVQSIDLTSDMKLGLYCKIPPRHLFIAQVWGTALGSIVNYSRTSSTSCLLLRRAWWLIHAVRAQSSEV